MRLAELDNGSYRLETDSGKEIMLSEFELLGLVQLSARFQDRLKEQREGHEHRPVTMERIAEIVVGLDSHHTEVVIRFVYVDGGEKSYAISPEDAESMHDGLAKKLEQIASAKRGRINN